MAVRPWVTPDEVRAYTEIESVRNRTDARLAMDIAVAENRVIDYTNNRFEDCYEVPDNVKYAVILLAEADAYNALQSAVSIKSESHDDYSYTAEYRELTVGADKLAALLGDYVVQDVRDQVVMRLRKL